MFANCAAGHSVWNFRNGLEAGAFEPRVAVDERGDFRSFREGDVSSAHDRNDYPCRGAGAFAFAAGAQNCLIIVREADASDKDTKLSAAAECFFWLRFVDHALGARTFLNYEQAIDDDLF